MQRLHVGPFAFAVLLMTAGAVMGQTSPAPPTDDDCLACHGDASFARPDGRSLAVPAEMFGASIHGQVGLGCVGCHADAKEIPHPETLMPVECTTCHADAAEKYAVSVHAEAARAGGGVNAACKDCHGYHDIRPSADPQSRTYHLNLPRTCGTCHSKTADPRGAGSVFATFQDSIHGRALSRGGLVVAPNCSSCHGAHDVRRHTDAESRVHRTHVPETCGTCHEGVERQYAGGVHGSELQQGNPLAPACDDCHTAHGIQRPEEASYQLQVVQECGTCHEESLKTYRDTFHGQVTSLGFVRVATCADCHGPHGILPPENPKSSVAPANLVTTCRRCHEGASERFVRYDPHADKHDRERNPLLYYSSRFMQLLLVGVFSFFGIHTTLWLTRSLRVRGRQPSPPARREPPPGPSPEPRPDTSDTNATTTETDHDGA